MAQYIDKSALVAEIERMLETITDASEQDVRDRELGGIYGAQLLVLRNLAKYLDTLEVKEVQEEPAKIWHDAKEPPEMYRKYFARYSDGRINGSWERHDNGFIPWKDVIKEHNITHWCYVEDLLKLKYYDR